MAKTLEEDNSVTEKQKSSRTSEVFLRRQFIPDNSQ